MQMVDALAAMDIITFVANLPFISKHMTAELKRI
jgi:hypothetical protein